MSVLIDALTAALLGALVPLAIAVLLFAIDIAGAWGASPQP